MQSITFNSHYELPGGSFDKDEQGWCASFVHIICEDGIHVKFREYYDANGIIRSDYNKEGTVEDVRGGVVYILLSNGRKLFYSLESNRLLEKAP